MPTIAVVAHKKKVLDGGLGELRELLSRRGFTEPIWYEVDKSRKAPKRLRRAIKDGADLVFVWGGDGMVQRCIDTVAGTEAVVAILPAGTGNLLANNLDIPIDLEQAVAVGLDGERRRLDTGVINGEHFAVMAGTGLDALMMRDADRSMKDRLGRAAYVVTGVNNLSTAPVRATVKVDGRTFYKGKASCILVGNVPEITGGIAAFDDARPDDGALDVGVVTATTAVQWARTLARVSTGKSARSPFVHVTRGRKVRIRLARALPYELDGGARAKVKRLKIDVSPASILIAVPPRAAP